MGAPRHGSIAACLALPADVQTACKLIFADLQVVKGQMFVVGEVAPWQSRHEYIKHQLLELARVDKKLPDLDMYFASEDIPEYCENSEGPPLCRYVRALAEVLAVTAVTLQTYLSSA